MALHQTPQQTILNELIVQNQLTCSFALDQVNKDNLAWKLSDRAASIGFIYRHIGEMINMFGYFLERPSLVQNTTMGQEDSGQGIDYRQSLKLIDSGYAMVQELVNEKADDWWTQEIDTPFFGRISKLRLFAHILYHNAHHSGQISMTLSRAVNKPR